LNARLPSSPSGVATVALLLLVAAGLSSQTAPPPSLTLLARDGRRALPITMVGDQEFIALDDLAAAFQLVVHEEAQGVMTVSYNGRTIILTAEQALASVAGRLISLPAPPTRSGRRSLVPVEFISRALALVYDARLDLRKPSRLLVIGDLRVPRITMRYDSLGASARLTIDATPRAMSTISQDNDKLTIKFDADALDVPSPPLTALGDQSLVRAVRLADPTTVAIDLGPRFASMKATSQPVDTTMRVVIDLLTAQTEAAPGAPAPPQAAPAPPPPDLPPALGPPISAVRTIAIDPGHGGDDDGVRGANGAKEKDLALAVARRAKGAIEARLGIRVLLTRDDDRNVPIDERTSIANNNKADLFLSLHANASLRKTTAGLSIFSAAFDDGAAQAAAPISGERVPTFGGGLREIDLVLWDLAQTRHLQQSTAFAAMLEQQLQNRVPLAPHPSDRAPLRVLKSANMPAVLIEMGYLTNPDQEKLLTSDGFQNALVQALFDTIVRFRDALPAGGTQ
jgi:N-acetylmuramoyl-L-alanine amidase